MHLSSQHMKRVTAGRRRNSRGRAWVLPFFWNSFGFAVLVTASITSTVITVTFGLDSLRTLFEQLPIILKQSMRPLNLFVLLNFLIVSIILITYSKGNPLHATSKRGQHETRSPFHLRKDSMGHETRRKEDQFIEGKDTFHGDGNKQGADPLFDTMLNSTDASQPSEHAHHELHMGNSFLLDSDEFDDKGRKSPEPFAYPAACEQQQPRIHESCTDSGKGCRKESYRYGSAFDESDVPQSIYSEDFLESSRTKDDRNLIRSEILTEYQPEGRNRRGQVATEGVDSSTKHRQSGLKADQDRPLASHHFNHRKSTTRANLSKDPLRTARASVVKGDTLDATWRAICDNKLKHSSPLRHHTVRRTKKADLDNNGAQVDAVISEKKDSSSAYLSPSKQRHRISSLAKRKELSIPRDELNEKVESFIAKFNQQIRIQREESLLNYRKMIERGAR
ncbi:hypothetical protein KP509_39G026200 [Ceratopteris richardii]|uniref:DUF4408 domain-containing protein n=1 Tax=Ceratopteris richardii TaxID=49495 RepID=A0A8T2Q088_CERRI|nr:hypothetical protein KP509_39G026200 [Ceratopteris richardii]